MSAEGYDPQLPARAGLTVLVHPRRGMRGALNAARAHVRGEWYMKCDEHCLFSEGFDEVLKADCADNWLLIPRRHSLDAGTPDAPKWEVENNPKGPRDYHFLTSPVWSIRERHDYSINGYEWPQRTRARLYGHDVDETMSWQGSFYFMSRLHYERIGALQEHGYGGFASEPQEIGLKTQLGGGAVMVTKKCWGAHLHKGKVWGRGYRPDKAEIIRGHEYSAWHWMTQPGMRAFIERWWPVPTWPADTLERWEWYFPAGASLELLKERARHG